MAKITKSWGKRDTFGYTEYGPGSLPLATHTPAKCTPKKQTQYANEDTSAALVRKKKQKGVSIADDDDVASASNDTEKKSRPKTWNGKRLQLIPKTYSAREGPKAGRRESQRVGRIEDRQEYYKEGGREGGREGGGEGRGFLRRSWRACRRAICSCFSCSCCRCKPTKVDQSTSTETLTAVVSPSQRQLELPQVLVDGGKHGCLVVDTSFTTDGGAVSAMSSVSASRTFSSDNMHELFGNGSDFSAASSDGYMPKYVVSCPDMSTSLTAPKVQESHSLTTDIVNDKNVYRLRKNYKIMYTNTHEKDEGWITTLTSFLNDPLNTVGDSLVPWMQTQLSSLPDSPMIAPFVSSSSPSVHDFDSESSFCTALSGRSIKAKTERTDKVISPFEELAQSGWSSSSCSKEDIDNMKPPSEEAGELEAISLSAELKQSNSRSSFSSQDIEPTSILRTLSGELYNYIRSMKLQKQHMFQASVPMELTEDNLSMLIADHRFKDYPFLFQHFRVSSWAEETNEELFGIPRPLEIADQYMAPSPSENEAQNWVDARNADILGTSGTENDRTALGNYRKPQSGIIPASILEGFSVYAGMRSADIDLGVFGQCLLDVMQELERQEENKVMSKASYYIITSPSYGNSIDTLPEDLSVSEAGGVDTDGGTQSETSQYHLITDRNTAPGVYGENTETNQENEVNGIDVGKPIKAAVVDIYEAQLNRNDLSSDYTKEEVPVQAINSHEVLLNSNLKSQQMQLSTEAAQALVNTKTARLNTNGKVVNNTDELEINADAVVLNTNDKLQDDTDKLEINVDAVVLNTNDKLQDDTDKLEKNADAVALNTNDKLQDDTDKLEINADAVVLNTNDKSQNDKGTSMVSDDESTNGNTVRRTLNTLKNLPLKGDHSESQFQ